MKGLRHGMQALKVLVIGMGIIIVLGLGLVAYGLVSRVSTQGAPGFGDVELVLPPGCGLAAAQSRDGRLVVRGDGPIERGCQQVFVIDMASGKILGRVFGTQGQ